MGRLGGVTLKASDSRQDDGGAEGLEGAPSGGWGESCLRKSCVAWASCDVDRRTEELPHSGEQGNSDRLAKGLSSEGFWAGWSVERRLWPPGKSLVVNLENKKAASLIFLLVLLLE